MWTEEEGAGGAAAEGVAKEVGAAGVVVAAVAVNAEGGAAWGVEVLAGCCGCAKGEAVWVWLSGEGRANASTCGC